MTERETNKRRKFVENLLEKMTLTEKLGQMHQVNGCGATVSNELALSIREGKVGSVINEVCPRTVETLQSIACKESRLGIPLLIGRDVIHGFKTIFPIPLGLAATWSTDLVEKVTRISALEASSIGINWTFSPMIDIARDPRWGRIAESLGEDPFLCSALGVAMVKGYQTDDLSNETSIAACAKHFAGYGASESGRDYNTTNISEHELRNVYLPPFQSATSAGVASIMTSFSDLNGLPATVQHYLLDTILRQEWRFEGIALSDWNAVHQVIAHGLAESDEQAGLMAMSAGIDVEMVSGTFIGYGETLVEKGSLSEQHIDKAVRRILNLKYDLGLFESSFIPVNIDADSRAIAFQAALEAAEKSCVLLQNDRQTLPLNDIADKKVVLLGMLADDAYEQLGTWIFDADLSRSITLRQSLASALPESATLDYCKVFENTRDTSLAAVPQAIELASKSDIAIVCLGEESILSGEAHCRTNIDLPGGQQCLLDELKRVKRETDLRVVLIIMAGRPLTLNHALECADAVIYAWHPGSAGGTALTNLVLGKTVPSGKLPVTFPRHVGQIPIYHSVKPSGRPVDDNNYVPMENFPMRAVQTSLGMASSHIDTHFTPLFPFGYGMSYASFRYDNLRLSKTAIIQGETLQVTVDLINDSDVEADEVVQLYVRDKIALISRPVRELKGFQRVTVEAKQTCEVTIELDSESLSFYDNHGKQHLEPGDFCLWIGGDSNATLSADFSLLKH